MEYVVLEQEKSAILRIAKKDSVYGDEYDISLLCTYYGKYNEIAYIEGLDRKLTREMMETLMEHLSIKGVRQIKWDHKEKHLCFDTVTQQMRIE